MKWFAWGRPVSVAEVDAAIGRQLRLLCGEPTVFTYSDGTSDLSFGPSRSNEPFTPAPEGGES